MIFKRMSFRVALAVVAAAVIGVSCAKSGDDDDDDDDSVTSRIKTLGQPGQAVTGRLNGAFPTELAIAAFPQSKDAQGAALQDAPAQTGEEKLVTEKIEENEARINGTADTCFDGGLFGGPMNPNMNITCYNFDSDMNPLQVEGDQHQSQEVGTKDGTDGNGEACMVAFARQEVKDAVDSVDRALALVTGMMCQGQKDGYAKELPGVDERLDLTVPMTNAVGTHLTVVSATLERLSDTEDGYPVYRSDIEVVDSEGRGMDVHLVHSPGDGEDSKGTLWSRHDLMADNTHGDHDPNNTANKNGVMSINYSKDVAADGSSRMRFEVRRAAIVNTVDPFTDEGLVNYSGVADDAQNSEIHAITYVAFDMDPDTNAGNLSYWQNPGGNYNESARGFLFNIAAAEDGTLSGCGTSGATSSISIRKSLAEPTEDNVLKPSMYWHPRGSQNVHPDKDSRYNDGQGPFVTKQCFEQNAEGVYEIDTSETTHERGYDVIQTAASDVIPPERPKDALEPVGGLEKPE